MLIGDALGGKNPISGAEQQQVGRRDFTFKGTCSEASHALIGSIISGKSSQAAGGKVPIHGGMTSGSKRPVVTRRRKTTMATAAHTWPGLNHVTPNYDP